MAVSDNANHTDARPPGGPGLSVVVPVHNEAGNVTGLIGEIRHVLDGGPAFEMIFVDDGSDDTTLEVLTAQLAAEPRLRVLRHGRCRGQSAAISSGVKAARAAVIATLDGDGQNDPADIPKLLAVLNEAETDPDLHLVAGHRQGRRDTWTKRLSSAVANGVRATLLGDGTPDTGCGLKVFTRAAYLDMPRFDHMHRFLPALMLRQGGRVTSVPVSHRPRAHGTSNYGVLDRLFVGLVDLMGVKWLQRRATVGQAEELPRPDGEPGT